MLFLAHFLLFYFVFLLFFSAVMAPYYYCSYSCTNWLSDPFLFLPLIIIPCITWMLFWHSNIQVEEKLESGQGKTTFRRFFSRFCTPIFLEVGFSNSLKILCLYWYNFPAFIVCDIVMLVHSNFMIVISAKHLLLFCSHLFWHSWQSGEIVAR